MDNMISSRFLRELIEEDYKFQQGHSIQSATMSACRMLARKKFGFAERGWCLTKQAAVSEKLAAISAPRT